MPTSDNHLAKLLREISQQRIAVPCLTGTEPLELLLEIGLEKIIKDYEYIFSESKICSPTDLNIREKYNIYKIILLQYSLFQMRFSFFFFCRENKSEKSGNIIINVRKTLLKPDTSLSSSSSLASGRKTLMHCVDNETPVEDIGFHNSKFDRQDIERKLAKLAQVHLILEHLALVQLHINPENMNSKCYLCSLIILIQFCFRFKFINQLPYNNYNYQLNHLT